MLIKTEKLKKSQHKVLGLLVVASAAFDQHLVALKCNESFGEQVSYSYTC